MRRRTGYWVLVAVMLGACGVSWGQKKASVVSPVDGATDVIVPVLQWKAGSTAVFHTVYFGTTPDLGPADVIAPRLTLNIVNWYVLQGIVPGTTYYWRIDETEKDLKTVIKGDVWMFIAWPTTAFLPDPPDRSNTAALAPVLTWLIGQGAQQHHVYFSDNRAAVVDGAAEADKGVKNDPNYVPVELLPAGTYFWRVDEIDAFGTVVPGNVWSFSTMLLIDDFEAYTNDVGQRVFQTWVDGWGYTEPAPGNSGNGTGASVGHDIWAADTVYTTIAETVVVHSGSQAMPITYDNTTSPFYSETDRTWTTPQDWTANGLDTLTLFVRGQARDFDTPKAATPPTIDAKVDEMWANASVQYISTVADGTAPSSPLDCSGSFRVMYDSGSLYMLVDVNDEALVQDSDAAQGWLDDRVEIFLDGNNSKDAAQDTTKDCQYCFRWNHAVVETPVEWYRSPDSLVGVKYAVTNTSTGYRMEIQLPWSVAIGGQPSEGQSIGIDVMINDDDDGGDRDCQMSWHGAAHVPSSWGTGLIGLAAANPNDSLYVALWDSPSRVRVVTHPDPAVVTSKTWVRWDIPLSDFATAGVNLANVQKMAVGVGARTKPVQGGKGPLYFDDIYLTRPAPAGE